MWIDGLIGAHDRGLDQLAAFDQLVQHGVQLSYILAREPGAGAGRRRRRHRRSWLRLARGMDRAIGRLDARHRRAVQRRLLAHLVVTLAEIAADQRREPSAQTAALVIRGDFRRDALFDEILVIARAMRRLSSAFLPAMGDPCKSAQP